MPQESVHALGEKHTGLGKVLINAGVRETHDLAGLKQAMQVIASQRTTLVRRNRSCFRLDCCRGAAVS